jgi:hypothetical protein
MDECPWCGEELDAEDIYAFGSLNNDGYFECLVCGGQFSILQLIEYSYEIAIGPRLREKDL